MSDPIAQALQPFDDEPGQRLRVGLVTSTTPVEVNLATQTGLPASTLASYTPVIGHRVLIAQNDTDLCILGRIIQGG